MIVIGVLALAVMVAVVVGLRNPSPGRPTVWYLALAPVPLVLTILFPLPFALMAGGPTDWARTTVLTSSRVGIALSFILFTIGVVLTLRAALAGDRRSAAVLTLETALAGLPAGILTAHTALARLL